MRRLGVRVDKAERGGMTYPVVKYPNYITPRGEYEIFKGRIPELVLTAWDGSVEFYLMGGRSIVDHLNPESAQIKDIKGIVGTWKTIDQKGATQDGVTFVTALGEPIKIEATVEVRGRTPERCRKVYKDLVASLDSKKTGELSFYTQDEGRWWGNVRWLEAPDDAVEKIQVPRQQISLKLRLDEGFWRSYDDVDSFGFTFEDMKDTFDVSYANRQTLGPNWPQYYDSVGLGYCYADNGRAIWSDDPNQIFFTGTKSVVAGPFKDYSAAADDVDVTILFANTPEYTAGSGAANDIWARMGRNMDGTWNGYGIRGRVGWGYTRISYFTNFTEHVLQDVFALIPPSAGELWTLRCTGRTYSLRRNGTTVRTITETGTTSQIGASYRGVGFGMQAGAAVITEATPGALENIQVDSSVLDPFTSNYTTGLGANWPLYYIGRGPAFIRAHSSLAEWIDNGDTDTQVVVNGPYKDFATTTNNQVITMTLGSFQEVSFPDSGANDLWGRMSHAVDGSWNGYGIRMRIENNILTLARFNNFVGTLMRSRRVTIPAAINDVWTLICGVEEDERTYRILRNGVEAMVHKETDEGSMVGSTYRGVGFGMMAGGAAITQATPASVREVTAADNNTVSQTGFLHRTNIGDQPMYDDYIVFGPGTFRFWNGPDAGANDYVEFGPVLANQVMYLRTDPRKRSVEDLTAIPASPQDLTQFQGALKKFLSFSFAGNTTPLVEAILSKFGVLPPQGNPYSLLSGRWSDASAIPAKSPGSPAETYSIKVQIDDGNFNSQIIATGTPRRRYPM